MDCARRLHNTTRCAALVTLLDDRHGREQVVTIVKATLGLDESGGLRWAQEPTPVRVHPEYRRTDRPSSVRFPSDLADDKPGTDVLVDGTAHPSPNGPEDHVDITLVLKRGELTRVRKQLRVCGPRVWQEAAWGIKPGPAARLEPTPICWELAYGGVDPEDPTVFDPQNPVGSGVAKRPDRLVGVAAPQIESPDAPCSSKHPKPAGLGPVSQHWEPRRRLMGTCDETWRHTRAPLWPADFDTAFNCWAPPDQRCDPALVGDETIELTGMSPEGELRFELPGYTPQVVFVERGRFTYRAPHLDTVILCSDRRRVELTWRATTPVPRKLSRLEAVLVLDPKAPRAASPKHAAGSSLPTSEY